MYASRPLCNLDFLPSQIQFPHLFTEALYVQSKVSETVAHDA